MIVTEAIYDVREFHNCAWTFETNFIQDIPGTLSNGPNNEVESVKSGSSIEVRERELAVPSGVAVLARARPAGLALLLAGPRLPTRREGIGRSHGVCQLYRGVGKFTGFDFNFKLQSDKYSEGYLNNP